MRNMIVAQEPVAVEAGALVLRGGGNAMDAAVTCALVQGVVNPHMCGLGGYTLLTYLPVNQKPIVLDAPALAGSLTSPAQWLDHILGPDPDGWGYWLKDKVNDVGYTSICTPGAVKGLATLLERWGTTSWAEAAEPATRLAEAGFRVSPKLAGDWKTRATYPQTAGSLDYVQSNAEARRIYLGADGSPYEAGETIRNPDYANTLRRLAERGPEDFYRGELARHISDDLSANGGFVTSQDLAEYQVRNEPALMGTYRGYTIATSPPPHGGPTLIALLNILEGYDLKSLGHNSPEYIYRLSLAMKAAFADRNPHLGDPAFVDVPLNWMIDKARAAEWRATIEAGGPIPSVRATSGTPHTTHVSVVDRFGNCAALTHSLGNSSGVITPGLGFIYNNSMINFHPRPGHPNSIAPRKGRTTGMSPTVISKDGAGPILVIGAPGASRIITSVAQVILNFIDFGMTIAEAVHAPRFDCQIGPIFCHLRIPGYVCDEVRRRHPIQYLPYSHGGMGLVHAITLDPLTGQLSGAADAGSDGMAMEI